MTDEIEKLQKEIKALKGEILELNKAVLMYSYTLKAIQSVVITNDTDRTKINELTTAMMGKYSHQLRASIAHVEGNDVLYRLFKNSDNNLEE